MERFQEINNDFRLEFINLYRTYSLGLKPETLDTLKQFLQNAIYRYQPAYVVTSEGIKAILTSVFRNISHRQFFEKLYFIFRSKISQEEYDELLFRLAAATELNTGNNNGWIPSDDSVVYESRREILAVLSSSPHIVVILLMILNIRTGDL